MESVNIDWTLIQEYTLFNCKICLYHGFTGPVGHPNTYDSYRYEVEFPDGELAEPDEPFPFHYLRTCKQGAEEEVRVWIAAGLS